MECVSCSSIYSSDARSLCSCPILPSLQNILRCICYISSIAFKPAESGWGGGSNKYNNNFDKIFGGGTKKTEKKDDERPAAEGGSIRDDKQ